MHFFHLINCFKWVAIVFIAAGAVIGKHFIAFKRMAFFSLIMEEVAFSFVVIVKAFD